MYSFDAFSRTLVINTYIYILELNKDSVSPQPRKRTKLYLFIYLFIHLVYLYIYYIYIYAHVPCPVVNLPHLLPCPGNQLLIAAGDLVSHEGDEGMVKDLAHAASFTKDRSNRCNKKG